MAAVKPIILEMKPVPRDWVPDRSLYQLIPVCLPGPRKLIHVEVIK